GQAFRIGRNMGINLASDSKASSWSIGVYEVGEYGSDPAQGGDGKLALTGRATLSPVNKGREVVHLGASFSLRDLDGAVFEVESNGEVHGAPDVLDTRNFEADSIDQYGLESAWISNRFALIGEAYRQDVSGVLESDSVSYSGYYVQGSYFLTDDSLRYKKGRLSSVRPTADSGAWQLLLRHSYLDADDNEDGMEVTNTLVGINYYYSRSTKLMLNFTSTEINGHDVEELDRGDAISLRAQFRF
ncbi:MAG: porin, partial [Porticoccaceae bacterium]